MKALTIRQPWASLIALGIKTIETRSWRAPQSLIGQTITIHAGKSDATWRELEAPSLMSERSTIQAVLAALPGVMLDERSWRATAIHDGAIRFSGLDLELPLGAIVASATLTDCVPMISESEIRAAKHQGPMIAIAGPACPVQPCVNWLHPHPLHGHVIDKDRTAPLYGQLPYGDFRPGRWAWMLTDVQPCDPVPAKGAQGLWTVAA